MISLFLVSGERTLGCQKKLLCPCVMSLGHFSRSSHLWTAMRDALSVETQVPATLYYLADEGRLRKVANAFGIGKSSVLTKIREKLSLCRFGGKYSGTERIQVLVWTEVQTGVELIRSRVNRDPQSGTERYRHWIRKVPIPCEHGLRQANFNYFLYSFFSILRILSFGK